MPPPPSDPIPFTWRRAVFGLALVLGFAWLTFRSPARMEHPVVEGGTMGTYYRVTLANVALRPRDVAAVKLRIEAVLAEVNRQMSTWDPESEISRFNRWPETRPFPASAGFSEVTRAALGVSAATAGAFDPTLGPLIDLWGFGATEPPVGEVTPEQVAAAMERVGFARLEVLPTGEIRKSRADLELNLSAIAKGYGVDRVVEALREEGFGDLFVDIGGEVRVTGVNREGQAWRVGIQAPTETADGPFDVHTIFRVGNLAVATSGDYRNVRVTAEGGVSHILDPRLGRPVHSDVASVSVVAPTCMEADAYATALFVMGPDAGLDLVESLPDLDAFFLIRGPDGTLTSRASSRLDLRVRPSSP